MKFEYSDMAKLMRDKDAKLIDRTVEIIRRDVRLHGPRLCQEEVQAAVPRIPVDRGTYRRSFRFENVDHGATAYNFSPHAPIIEAGRRPGGRMPPVAAILAWMRRKKIGLTQGPAVMSHTVLQKGARRQSYGEAHRELRDSQLEHVALQIARAIRARGLPAHHILGAASIGIDRQIQADIKRELESES